MGRVGRANSSHMKNARKSPVVEAATPSSGGSGRHLSSDDEGVGPSEEKLRAAQDIGLNEPIRLNASWNVERAVKELEEWPAKVEGYKELLFFLFFFMIYVLLQVLQINPWDSFAVNSALKTVVSGYDQVSTQDDWFAYANTTLSKIFRRTWYNGDTYTTNENGYVNYYNKLVGGVLIIQERGLEGPCGASLYSDFYGNCHYEDRSTENFSSAGSVGGGNYSYDFDQGGYAQFFSVAMTPEQVGSAVTILSKSRWIDKNTRKLFIKFAVYNGEYGIFSFAKISFTFGTGGVMFGNNVADIQSARMELYLKADDWGRLVVEIIFMYMASWFLSEELLDFVETVLQTRSTVTGKLQIGKGIKSYFSNPSNFADLANHALVIAYVISRARYVIYVYKNPIKLPTNRYQIQLEEVALMQADLLLINTLNIFVKILHLFKYFAFQPRMAIISSTITKALPDLFHFFMLFSCIFLSYSVMGIILFGPHLESFSSFGLISETLGQMLIGNFDPYKDMRLHNPLMSTLFFWSYMLLVFFILVNVFLAVIIDAYSESKTKSENTSGIPQDFIKGIRRLLQGRPDAVDLPSDPLKECLLYFQSRGLKSLDTADLKWFMQEKYGIVDDKYLAGNESVLVAMECLNAKQDPNCEMNQLLKAAWVLYDKDNSGFLDKIEFEAFLNDAPIKLEKTQTAKIDALLAAADRNGDGVISYDEFVPVFHAVMLESLAIASKTQQEAAIAAAKAASVAKTVLEHKTLNPTQELQERKKALRRSSILFPAQME